MDEAGTGPDRVEVLRRAPLFAGLGAEELAGLEARCEVRTFQRDEVVFRVGDAGDELLVVAWGELAVSNDAGVVARLRAGDCAGELALLLDEPRSATITCTRAACVLVVGREDFRELVRDDARVLAHLTQMLSRRTLELVRSRPSRHSTATLVAVVADPGVPGASLVAASIAAITTSISPRDALLIRVGAGRRSVSSVVRDAAKLLADTGSERSPVIKIAVPAAGPAAVAEAVAALVAAAGERFRIIVIDVPAGPPPDIEALRQWCDAVVHVTTSAAGPPSRNVLRLLNRRHRATPAMPMSSSEPYLLPDDETLAGLPAVEAAALVLASPLSPAGRTLSRLTRSLLGASVGIALGAGAALGIAHIGVIVALEEAGIPVDLAAGTSMGSVVAIGVGAGLSGTEMLEMARRLGTRRTTMSILQPALTGTGLLNTKRFASLLMPLITPRRFTELIVPVQVVALDIGTGERVAIGTGLLEEAFRASCAVPLVFAPSTLGGRTLVDGAMTDPVPADVAREMGADLVIGVNVAARPVPGSSNLFSRVLQQVNRANPFALGGVTSAPGLVDVLMSTLQVIQYELGEFRNLAADVRACVDLDGFTWIDFHRAMELVDRGHATGAAMVPEIHALLAARLA